MTLVRCKYKFKKTVIPHALQCDECGAIVRDTFFDDPENFMFCTEDLEGDTEPYKWTPSDEYHGTHTSQ